MSSFKGSRGNFRRCRRNSNDFQQSLDCSDEVFDNIASHQHDHGKPYRTFYGGQETKNAPKRDCSLSDQRAKANFNKNRSKYKKGDKNFNSVTNIKKKYIPENIECNIWKDKTDTESVVSGLSDTSQCSWSSKHSSKFKFDLQNKSNIKAKEYVYDILPGTVNADYLKSQATSLNDDSQDCIDNMDRLTDCLSAKENFENILKTMKPSDIIISYRKQVDELAKDCVAQNFKKIDKILSLIKSHNQYSKVLKLHQNNLLQQQQKFENFITETKLKFSSIYSYDLQDILKKADDVKISVENECSLFKRSLPAYGLKSDVLKNVSENQVTIISADSSYFFNIVIPLIIKQNFPDYLLISCEACEILRSWLKINFNNLFQAQACSKLPFEKYPKSFYCKTEDELLDELSSNNEFYKENFIVILNLPLKRTVIADFLLCNLRDLLKTQKNSKFILLLSPYDDISKYENYFSKSTKISVLLAPNLIFPVKTVWKSALLSSTDDYKEEVIRTVMAIHVLNSLGDILVFLPSVSDAKSVSAVLNRNFQEYYCNDVEIVLLHEDSSNESCLDISDKKESSKRTVFIATGCAEMIIIPSVNYVVDCGLRKEYLFDSNKSLDVLKTTFISHAKANVRKFLVGIFSSGTCYRLYSKDNFRKEMLHQEYPEILTVNPINTMIKFFHSYSDSATSVQFIEPLSEGIKNNAVEFLKKCNAIRDGKLTILGKDMVKLPFPTRYSKFILQGIQWGLGYEVVVLMSFFSVKARVFQYSDDENKQRVIDAVKLQFIQNDSDTLSYLHIFKLWLENNCSASWCDRYYINSHTMKLVVSKVKEVCHIINERLKENIVQNFSNENCSESLKEILFDCFQDNLCVFTGHYKSGYRVLFSHCIAFIHPSSMLFQMENLPQFIIFDHILSTRRDFLVDVTVIPKDLVKEAINAGKIECDFSDICEKTLTRKVMQSVSERQIKQVLLGKKGKKLNEIEDYIKNELNCESIVIEPLTEKGCVAVYALENKIDDVIDTIENIIKSSFEAALNVEQTNIYELVKDEIKIPIEVKWVKGAQTISAEVKSRSQNNKVGVMQNNLVGKSPLETEPLVIQHSINLTWVRRACTGKGFVNFFSYFDFMKARKLTFKCFPMLGTEIFIKISKKDQNQLFISEIPPDTRQSEFEEAFGRLLPDIKFQKVELLFDPPYDTSSNDLQEIKTQIQANCEEYADLGDYDIVVPKPKASATIMKAYVNIYDDIDLEHTAKKLSNTMIENFKVTAVPVYRSVTKCNLLVCKLLKSRFEQKLGELEQEFKVKYVDKEIFLFDIVILNEECALIKLLSNYKDVIKKLRRTVNDLLEGEVLSKNNIEGIHKLFCHGGHVWIKTLEKTENVCVMEDYNSRIIRLYGSQVDCFHAKERIIKFLDNTENEIVKPINLCSKNGNKMLLKAVIVKYGVNLENFIESCELRSAVLNIRSSHLLLHGCRESIEKAEDCIKELARGMDSFNVNDVLSSEICPVCACPALSLTFRLEHCNHLYCRECLQGLIDQAHFPIQCCAENCFKEIVLDDIWRLYGDDAQKIAILVEKSLQDYLEKSSSKIFYCPAPDCQMFFYRHEIDTKWRCPLCENDICVNCNAIYHQGYTCDMYQGSKLDPDYSFKAWKKTTSLCKACPKCNSAIEKNEGCNHMTCILCKAHFCWLCVREFPTANEVHNHQPYCTEYT